ncbi:hypothetical protein [Couchioplanes caeruleus]|uniref:Uncharacterized protein n=2 Tax=Couchioplanes caeruleus TaxID=56438 RepID=A0A1K0GT76_9ACTN|nr:hypothetical protein [Couchioplanes caeruleus]OJF14444.1 hypothetical protein BG844_09740 [Couchioplanes caeruleus subsp. caeruleus]ROP34002.1 hypothetical protein EDD30_7066 [Couchioplanes caeruleus]
MTTTTPGRLFHGLLDDAAIFPPGDAPMADAVRAHVGRWQSPQAPLLGPFICSLPRWGELTAVLSGAPPLPLSLTLPGGAEQVAAAVAEVGAEPAVRLVALEVAGSAETLPGLVATLHRHVPPGVSVYVELPLADVTAPHIGTLVGAGLRLKIRTGGVVAAAYPGERELAGALLAAVRSGAAFKLTAGLHDPVRHRDPVTGFEHHGFLNVILATARAVEGSGADAVAEALADQDGARVAAAVAAIDDSAAGPIRRHFISFGTCSVSEPIDGLRHHGLLPEDMR